MQNKSCGTLSCAFARIWRAALAFVAIAIAVLPPRIAAQMKTTTVQGTIYRADGTAASGTLLISWPAFTTPQNQAVAAGNLSTAIGSDGFVSVNLTPNEGALPAGSYYTAVYHLNDGTVNQEYWVVPATATATIASVRAQLQPSTIAVQPVSMSYVDSAISSLSGSWLPLAGGTMTGPLTLNSDPASSSQAATKHYADTLAASELPLGGGTLTGPLTLAADPATNLQAATKEYVDSGVATAQAAANAAQSTANAALPAVAGTGSVKQLNGTLYADQMQSRSGSNDGIAMSLAECATYSYACQVIAPALYAQTETQPWGGSVGYFYGQMQGPAQSSPYGCVLDQRWGAPQWICNSSPWNPIEAAPAARHSMGPAFVTNVISVGQGSSPHTAPGLVVGVNLWAGGRNFTPDQAGSTNLLVQGNYDSPSSINNLENNLYGNSNGDNIGILENVVSYGGTDTGQDEGNEDTFNHVEASTVIQGKLNSVTPQTGTVDPNPCTAPCSVLNITQTQGQNGQWGSRLELVDLSQADSSGYITSIGSSVITSSGADWDSKYGDSVHTTITSSLNATETITGYQVVSNPGGNLVILTVSSNMLNPPAPVSFSGLSHATFLNGQTMAVYANLGPTQFEVECTAAMTCPVTPLTADNGTVGVQGNMYPLSNVTFSVASAAGFTTSLPACVFDAYEGPTAGITWDCSPVTNVNTSANTITLAVLRAPYGSGDILAQGGLTGYGFTMQADWVGPGSLGAGGSQGFGAGPGNLVRPVYPIIYNSPGNQVVVQSLTWQNTRAYAAMGAGGAVTANISNGTVTSCTASGGSGYGGSTDASGNFSNTPQLSYTVNSGATPPVLAITGQSSGAFRGCQVVSGGSGITSIAVTVAPLNPYVIYPMAHTQNVWNPATGMAEGSSIAVDALMGTFNKGDTLELEHYYISAFRAEALREYNWRPSAGKGQVGVEFDLSGFPQFAYLVNHSDSPLLYRSFPGGTQPWTIGQSQIAIPPDGFLLQGPFNSGLRMTLPPFGAISQSNGVVNVGCSPYCSSWNGAYSVIQLQNSNNGWDALTYAPSTQAWNWTSGAGGSSGCSVALNGSSSGGLSLTCNGNTSKFDTSGDLSLPGSVRAQAVSGAAINGEITVDGAVYTTLNAAWNAAVNLATSTGQNQTLRLGPGTFNVTATMTEPSNGACVSVLGSGGTTMNADSAQIATTLSVPSSLGGDIFFLGNASQAQGCTFRDLNILASGNATHGFELQWFRGVLLDNVTVNDTTAEGILLGEENTSSGHQANFLARNVTVSYSSAAFTPASRSAYGIHLQKTAIDSHLDDIIVRNALTAAVYNEGTGNTGYLIHGFGYPYTCTTAPCSNTASSGTATNASYATSYVIYDTGGSGSVWTDTYADSPAVAGFYIGANGTAIHGGHIQWPDLVSFPAANLAYVASTVTNNLLIADVDCLEMATGVNWITWAGSSGNPPTYASVHHLTGCGNYYQALEDAEVTGFSSGGANINDPSSAVPRVWSTPIASAASYPAYSAQMYTGYQGDAFQAHFSGVNPFFNVTYQGTIRTNGGIALSTVINTASTLTLTAANKNVIANASSGAQTITVPSCYTALPDKAQPTGLEFTIVKSDTTSNAITLQTVSSQNINYAGASAQTLTISAAGKRTLVCGPDYNWYAF